MVDSTPKLPLNFKKPNEEEHKKALEEVNARIDKLQKQMDAVKEKINKLPGKADNTRRDELRTLLQELRDKQAEIKKGKQAVFEQLDALNDSIRKKVGNVKALQSKVPYKTVTEVDERISELETKIEGGVRLVEEKKMLQEITTLKRNRSAVEGLDEQQAAIDKERAIYDELRKRVDDGESKKLSEQYEKANEEFRLIQTDQMQVRENRNKLYDERTRLKGLLDEEYTKLRTMRDEYRKANDEYYTFLRQLREHKKEQERLRKIQEEASKREEAAKQELELASLPAFEHEITLCENLSIFLQGFLNKSDTGANGAVAAAADSASPANVSGRVVEAPEGFVLKSKSEREEEDLFFMGGGGKKKGNKRTNTNKENKSDALKLPLTTMEGFFEVKVTVPTKLSDITSTLEKLKERKAYYLAEQPRVTEENKKKAQKKIDAMLKAEQEEKEQKEQEQKEQEQKEQEQKEQEQEQQEQEQEKTQEQEASP